MAEASGLPGPSQAYTNVKEGYSDERFTNVVEELWGIKINPQEFQRLEVELVQKIYYAFLKDIGVNLERLNEIPPQLLATIQYPEDYVGAVRLTVLSSNMRKYFKLIFNDESFRMADVFNPKPKRTKKFFAMIYNFIVHTEDTFGALGEIEDEVNMLMERRDKMNTKLNKINQLITERKADNAISEVSKEEEMTRLEEKTKELQKCQEEKMVLKGQLDALNMSLASLSTTKKDMELRIMEAKDEKQRLEGLVIQASEEEEIRKRNEKLASLKEENQRRKDHLLQLQQNIKSTASLKEKVDKLISLLHELRQEKSKEKDLQTSIDERVSEISKLHEKIKCQEEQTLQSTQHLASAETEFQNKQNTWELKQKSLDKEIKEQKQVLEDICRNQTEQDIVSKDMMDNIADVEEQIQQSKERINTTNAMIRDNYKSILDVVEQENVKLAKTLKDAAETLEEFKKLAD